VGFGVSVGTGVALGAAVLVAGWPSTVLAVPGVEVGMSAERDWAGAVAVGTLVRLGAVAPAGPGCAAGRSTPLAWRWPSPVGDAAASPAIGVAITSEGGAPASDVVACAGWAAPAPGRARGALVGIAGAELGVIVAIRGSGVNADASAARSRSVSVITAASSGASSSMCASRGSAL
jgi:hypothetical protein